MALAGPSWARGTREPQPPPGRALRLAAAAGRLQTLKFKFNLNFQSQLELEVTVECSPPSPYTCRISDTNRDGGRGASEGYNAPVSRPVYACWMLCSRLSFGPALMFATLRAYSSAGTMEGDPYVYRKCNWHSCLAC